MIENENPDAFADSETAETTGTSETPEAQETPEVDAAVEETAAEEAPVEETAAEPATDQPEVAETAEPETDAAGTSVEEIPAGSGDTVADAAAALGDTSAEDQEAAYRKRLREFTRELKKQPGTWYIVQTYSGYENKVKTNLDMRAQTLEVEEYIHDVVVPVEQVAEIKDGKRKIVKRKLLPGYVLVRMDLNDSSWSVVRDTPGVTSFVGNEGNATPVKHRDVAKFLLPKEAPAEGSPETAGAAQDGELAVAMPEEENKPKFAYDFEVGDAVTILDGAFASVAASISSIDPATGRIEALVSIFGRETPVELTADQIEKIN